MAKKEEFEITSVKKEVAERDNTNRYFVFKLSKINLDATKEAKYVGVCMEKDSKNLFDAIKFSIQSTMLNGGQKYAKEFYDNRHAIIEPVADNLSQRDAMTLASDMIYAIQPPWNAILK